MKFSEYVLTLLSISAVPLLMLYLYETVYNYKDQEDDEVPLDDEEEKEEVGD